jgi:hypothetical protein
MELRTIDVKGVEFDVFYEFSSERDPLGTGDSPTAYHVEIKSIELIYEPIDIIDYLAEWVIQSIYEQIIEIEAN